MLTENTEPSNPRCLLLRLLEYSSASSVQKNSPHACYSSSETVRRDLFFATSGLFTEYFFIFLLLVNILNRGLLGRFQAVGLRIFYDMNVEICGTLRMEVCLLKLSAQPIFLSSYIPRALNKDC